MNRTLLKLYRSWPEQMGGVRLIVDYTQPREETEGHYMSDVKVLAQSPK